MLCQRVDFLAAGWCDLQACISAESQVAVSLVLWTAWFPPMHVRLCAVEAACSLK